MKYFLLLFTTLYSSLLLSQIPFHNVNTQKFGVIDKKGNILSEAVYNNEISFNNGYSPINLNGKWGLINKKGEVIIKPQYQEMGRTFNEGYINVKKNGQWGYIDVNNNVKIAFQFDWCGTFCDEITWIQQGNVFGFIDKTGNELSPIWYNNILGIKNGKGYAKKGNKVYKITTKGTTVLNNQKKDFGEIYGCYKISIEAKNIHQLKPFLSKENRKWGYKNKEGEIVIKSKYKQATHFIGNYAYVEMEMNYGKHIIRRPAIIDFKGNTIIEPKIEYKGIIRIVDNIFKISVEDKSYMEEIIKPTKSKLEKGEITKEEYYKLYRKLLIPPPLKFIYKNNKEETIFEQKH